LGGGKAAASLGIVGGGQDAIISLKKGTEEVGVVKSNREEGKRKKMIAPDRAKKVAGKKEAFAGEKEKGLLPSSKKKERSRQGVGSEKEEIWTSFARRISAQLKPLSSSTHLGSQRAVMGRKQGRILSAGRGNLSRRPGEGGVKGTNSKKIRAMPAQSRMGKIKKKESFQSAYKEEETNYCHWGEKETWGELQEGKFFSSGVKRRED